MEVKFYPHTDPPDILNSRQNRFTVDVLIYSKKLDEHTIGWYDWINNEWLFLCREAGFDVFEWRFFHDEIDKTKKIKKKK